MKELETLRDGVTNLATAMGGPDKFIANLGGVKVKQISMGVGGRGTRHRLKLTNSSRSFDEWTVIHELGHSWDANFGWRLSRGLEKHTKGYTDRAEGYEKFLAGQCDPDRRQPGCNIFGYFYGDIPPAGSNWRFNRKEDFAESVAAYVDPIEAQARAARFREPYLNYPDYTGTLRYTYIDGLIKGTITVP